MEKIKDIIFKFLSWLFPYHELTGIERLIVISYLNTQDRFR